jgi:hypothetical protein
MSKQKRFFILLLGGGLLFATFFGIYLGTTYQNLKKLFLEPQHFVPTRIYSDVFRIAPSVKKSQILGQLQRRHYSWKEESQKIIFVLRSLDYPPTLLPDQHPNPNYAQLPVTLEFDDNSPSARLIQIFVNDQEITDLYLEPELVTTLSRGGPGETTQIRDFAKFEDIPAHVWKAIIAIEDHHYLDHKGFDPRGLARALLVNLGDDVGQTALQVATLEAVFKLAGLHGTNVFAAHQ